jgi:hypothetical protein
MPPRKKAENGITLPKTAVRRADEVRTRLAQLRIDEGNVADALAAARQHTVPGLAGTADELDALFGRGWHDPLQVIRVLFGKRYLKRILERSS